MELRVISGELLDQDMEVIVNSWNRNIEKVSVRFSETSRAGNAGVGKRGCPCKVTHNVAQ